MSPIMTTYARTTLRGLLRRRLVLAILTALPIAFYVVSHDAVGRSVRALVFGITWAVSTVAFFVTIGSRETEPRLVVAGVNPRQLAGARIASLCFGALVLAGGFWALVALDQDVRSNAALALDYLISAMVSVGLGTAVGSLIRKELEGTLVLFLFAGLQAVVNPVDAIARFLPLWSSRELATYAVDGANHASLWAGLSHAGLVMLLCVAISWCASRVSDGVVRR